MNKQQHTYQASTELTALVNQEMQADGLYHPNLGGITRSGMANHFPMTIMSLAARMADICKAAVALYLHEPAFITLHAVTAAVTLSIL